MPSTDRLRRLVHHGGFTQERIVFLLAVLLFAVFSATLPGFATVDNVLPLLRNVSVLGILGLAMALVIIGRGIDLSLVATMVIAVAWALSLARPDESATGPLLMGLALVLLVGIINGILIAYVEISALFATLGTWAVIYGFGMFALLSQEIIPLSTQWEGVQFLGTGSLLGIPMPVVVFCLVALLAWLFLRYARAGLYVRAIGDNPQTARLTGIGVRPVICLQYVLSAAIGYLAGIVTAATVATMNTRVANSSLVYDVILVVVLGGIGLSGGKGGVRNVIVGTLLIGILINGMTIMNLEYTTQNIIKSVILLIAIVVDSVLNPRDEQTAQQGDI
ncbi:ABC transporter permease [Castellaniella sp.]|uniref:ABC transporter permease n=1 Tax=Castellaniella sp. TaxID=1955812 RepID=UPI00356B57C9